MKKVLANKEKKKEEADAESGITRIKICDDDLDEIALKCCTAKEHLTLQNDDEDVILVDDEQMIISDGSDLEDDECQIIES